MHVRVRFAPSPTGTLHIGSARTALFNWLYARHTQGTLVLRIEDTDQKRSDPKFLDDILESLRWLGIQPDEGPIHQSRRLELYRAKAEGLLKSGRAQRQEGAVVMPIEPRVISFTDVIHGRIDTDATLLKDIVLIKSDGTPTYNFACVVDDADMRITHIIRGDDHIANTPKQIILYEALGAAPPLFAHIPLIVDEARARLSKRKGATSVLEFRDEGFLSEGIVNFLTLLGWSPKDNREIIPVEETIRLFDVKDVKKTAAQFNAEKLTWVNAQQIKRLTPERLLALLLPRLQAKGWVTAQTNQAWLLQLARVFQGRLHTLAEIETLADFCFTDDFSYQAQAVEKHLRKNGTVKELALLKERLASAPAFDAQTVETATRGLVAELGKPAGELIHPARVAITGREVSPGLFEVMALLGRDKTLLRLERAIRSLT
ncbi:MAG: glutamate--tRNA ligase [Candidatus Omnitrophica bacterium]|nr:glutamate--tRNA ligase [Candidatus Omnitrophota bacterium]